MPCRLLAVIVAVLVVTGACSSAPDGDADTAEPDPGNGSTTADSADASGGDDSSGDDGGASVAGDGTAEPTPELVPDDAIVIGAISDHTGLMSALDVPALEAARVQVARVNQAGGVLGRPLVLREYDTRSLLNDSFQAATELADDGAEVFLVTCDYDFARPAIEVAADAGILVLSPCGGTPEWGNPAVAGSHVFSFAMPSANEGILLADLVLESYGTTVTMVIDATDPDAQIQCGGFEQQFRASGGRFRGRLEVDDETLADLNENVASLVATTAAPPDAVVLCASPAVGQDLIYELRRAGVGAPIVAGSTMDGESWIANVESVGEMSVLSYASVFGDDPDPAVTALFDEYEILTAERPDHGRPVTGADAVEAFAVAAERAGSLELDALVSELEGFDHEKLVAGTVTFTPTAHLSARAMRLLEIVDRRLRFVEMVGSADDEVVATVPTPTAVAGESGDDLEEGQ